MNETRTCSGCTACCKTHAVRELSKQEGRLCSWCEAGVGCKIYDTRPDGCRDFVCQWRMGLGRDSDRPDLSHVVIDYFRLPGIERRVISLWEVEEGALRRACATRLIADETRKGMPVLLMSVCGEAVLVAPRGSVNAMNVKLQLGRKLTVVETWVDVPPRA